MAPEVLVLDPILLWVGALSVMLSFAATIWGLISSPSKANAERLKHVAERLDGHDLRLSGVEQSLRAMPSKDDMHGLQLSLTGMDGKLLEMKAVMEGNNRIMERLEAIVTRHEEHLLQQGANR